ncbi:MAG: hypothetical protein KGQ52_13415 [Alphaproteobacteria bacterium]|nr:hypothetical protein [Alphaproteobacteria bacterium]
MIEATALFAAARAVRYAGPANCDARISALIAARAAFRAAAGPSYILSDTMNRIETAARGNRQIDLAAQFVAAQAASDAMASRAARLAAISASDAKVAAKLAAGGRARKNALRALRADGAL